MLVSIDYPINLHLRRGELLWKVTIALVQRLEAMVHLDGVPAALEEHTISL